LKTKSLIAGLILPLIFYSTGYCQVVDDEIIKKDSIFQDTLNTHLLDSVSGSTNDTTLKAHGFVLDSLKYGNGEDTVPTKKRPSDVFSDNVTYNAKDSTIYSIDGKKVFLFGDAEINYEDIVLKAAYIEVDMEENILYAEGLPDSVGNIAGQPIFTQGSETMQAKTITYNVKTEKGFIKGLYTEQEEGYLHSQQTKKEPNDQINLYRGKYSTCELEDPHFYLWLSRGKVIPDKAIIASFSYLVIEDIPLYPIMVPFGFFPSTKERASGFIIPKFGEENSRGFFLRNGGYYFAISDYVDLTLQGDIYSLGSWQINAQSKYKMRYKFGGNVNLSYSKVVAGEPGTLEYVENNQYSIQWTHTQDAKARPNSNFSASVNFTSMDNNKYNSTTSEDYLTNTTSSSISFRKTFANTPFTMSLSVNHSQNSTKKIMTFNNLPQASVNMSRIFPFRRKVAVGKAKWYENIGITYTGNIKNSLSAPDSVVFTKAARELFKNGSQHSIPLSTSVKVLKYFNLSPSINFTDRIYFDRTFKTAAQYVNNGAVRDTVLYQKQKGFYNVYDYSYSLGLGTTIYGMFQFKSKYVKAIRHVATPSVSVSYRPDFQESKWGYYVLDPMSKDTTKKVYYSPYKDGIFGVPGAGKSGVVSFSLNNNVEMKVANKKDTVTGETKVKLLESLSFSTSYNMMADEFNWAPISMSARTTLFKSLSINMSATGNLYAIDDSSGQTINEFHFKHYPGQPFRLTSARISTGYSFNSQSLSGGDSKTEGTPTREAETPEHEEHAAVGHSHDYYGYDYFKIPWNLRVDYSLSYSKAAFVSDITQTLSFSGDFSLTSKWKVGFRSGWDFEAKDFSYTSFNLSRDLHCWVATLSLVPFGTRQSYTFSIGVKSSVLQDLKYNKNRSWQDNAY